MYRGPGWEVEVEVALQRGSYSWGVLRLPRRRASRVLCYGRKKVWLDPGETNETASNSCPHIWKLIKDGLMVWKPVTVHFWAQCRGDTLA